MSLNESQWREFSDKSDVSELYDGPCGDELGALKMVSIHAGCILLLCEEEEEEEDWICGRICQQQIWRKLVRFI